MRTVIAILVALYANAVFAEDGGLLGYAGQLQSAAQDSVDNVYDMTSEDNDDD